MTVKMDEDKSLSGEKYIHMKCLRFILMMGGKKIKFESKEDKNKNSIIVLLIKLKKIFDFIKFLSKIN